MHPSIHSWCAGGCWFTLAERNRLYSLSLFLFLSLSLQRKYRGEVGRTTHFCCSFPHSRQQLSFPGQCTALQIIHHLPALGAGFSLFGSPNNQATSFGVLVFRCRGLFCGVCVFFWDHPCYRFLDLCFPRWVLVAEYMGRRKLVGD
jgi:hypothetical protein